MAINAKWESKSQQVGSGTLNLLTNQHEIIWSNARWVLTKKRSIFRKMTIIEESANHLQLIQWKQKMKKKK